MTKPIPLTKAAHVDAAQIGGKAASLARLAQAGFRVPDGVVLPADWFEPWWEQLRGTDAWSAFARASDGPWDGHCRALQAAARSLTPTPDMRGGLDDVLGIVASWGDDSTCAVRSSSPEEDLESASFAGGYVTVLGVRPPAIEDAVRECFVSALDERVAVYKKQHGFDVHRPRIAVLVQRLVESDVAGVAFSLNPLNNDFDEAVVDASFGLGETVVSGEVTPDHFVVDKPGRAILERRIGSKGVSRRSAPGGGVERIEQDRGDEACLTDEQVLELVDVVGRVERLYGVPIDVEWALAAGELHLLQARPVTTYLPLPAEMLTEPGERRRLYVDRSLTDAFTTNTPLARLSLDMLDQLIRVHFQMFGIPYEANVPPDRDLVVLSGTRVYAAYSQIFWWVGPEKLAAPVELIDRLLSRTLANVDRARYMPERRPIALSFGRLMRVLWGTLRNCGRALWRTILAFASPNRFMRHFRADVEEYERAVRSTREDASVSEVLALNARFFSILMEADLPAIYPWSYAGWVIDGLRKKSDAETSALLDQLNRGYEGELVVDMGIEMFAMTRLLDAAHFEDLDALASRIEARDLPAPFLEAWDAFNDRYGCRGPMEMDLRSPRYGDTPLLLLRQMSFMTNSGPEHDPALAHARAVEEREQAFTELMRRSGWLRRRRLRRAHRLIKIFARERDTAKHHWVMVAGVARRNALALGARFVTEGRLDDPEDVFHLTWRQLEAGESDPGFDLRSPAAETRADFRRVETQVREFPHVIDSRGRILRPAPEPDDGALHGLGISPGIARGPVKVLEDPYQKKVEPGDVLVAYTTDPGWTPLFVNASAIILQVGGVMQHGGVVAREYGKPCVAGIERVLTRFEDGQVVEVDGSEGTVRLDPA
jgi:pyruvate,water dikinase